MLECEQPQPITQLLQAWSDGDKESLSRLIPMVYGELRRMARRRITSGQGNHSVSPSTLVSELYLRLAKARGLTFSSRSQFFGLAAQMMRSILTDAAKNRGRAKRGGDMDRVSFEDAYLAAPGRDREIIALDDGLTVLAKVDPRKARIVELRFFGGLTIEETAEVMEISVQTVRRDWTIAQAWLSVEITRGRREQLP